MVWGFFFFVLLFLSPQYGEQKHNAKINEKIAREGAQKSALRYVKSSAPKEEDRFLGPTRMQVSWTGEGTLRST